MTSSQISSDRILEVARESLGFDTLRPGQLEAIESILEGGDTLAVQPTGSGKSAIYQIAGLLIDGPTVVVSPLIALQKDQVDAISRQNSAPALALNSMKRNSEVKESLEHLTDGSVEYIFLAPEQLRKEETLERLRTAGVSLFVVDEAHCVSEWGHNFRPDYLNIGRVIEALGHPRVLALTATASPRVRDEIAERLVMRNPRVLVQGFDRPNIFLRVDRFEKESEKHDALVHKVVWADKPGIVYAGTRKAAEKIVADLAGEGIESILYHAGVGREERESAHERFMAGEVEVIVATNAFGMGVDKPDVRFVYHYHAPESLDAYYQEIGRAGRDGERSEALLFYRHQDIGAQSYKAGEGTISTGTLEEVTQRIVESDGPVAPKDIAADTGIHPRRLTSALHRLEDAGAVEILPTGEVVATEDANPQEALSIASEQQDSRRETRRALLMEMQDYAEASGCRRELLLRHLGDSFSGPCGFCDICEGASPNVVPASEGTRREVA